MSTQLFSASIPMGKHLCFLLLALLIVTLHLLWSKSVSESGWIKEGTSHLRVSWLQNFPSPWLLSLRAEQMASVQNAQRDTTGTGQTSGGCVARDQVWRRNPTEESEDLDCCRDCTKQVPPPTVRPLPRRWGDPRGPGNDLTGLRACFPSFLNFNGHVPIYLYHLGKVSWQLESYFSTK